MEEPGRRQKLHQTGPKNYVLKCLPFEISRK